MRKLIYVCDRCNKEIEEKDMILKNVGITYFECCKECVTAIENCQNEMEKEQEKYHNNLEKIATKYGLQEKLGFIKK